MRQVSTFKRRLALHYFRTLRGFLVERHRWSERLGHQLLSLQVHVSVSLSFTVGYHCKGNMWYFVNFLSRPDHIWVHSVYAYRIRFYYEDMCHDGGSASWPNHVWLTGIHPNIVFSHACFVFNVRCIF